MDSNQASNAGKTNWIWLPATNCISYLADEMSLGGLIKIAITSQSGLPLFLALANEAVKAQGRQVPGMDLLLAAAERSAPRAREQLELGFHRVHAHALINMWGAVLLALEQTLAACVSRDKSARKTALQIIGDKGNQLRELQEDEVAGIATRLVQRATAFRPAQQGYPSLCARFGLEFDGEKYRFPQLEEVRCIRNSLVHRGGIVTQQLAKAAPAFRELVGKPIKLDEKSSARHAEAMSNFALALSDAAIHSRYCLGRTGHGD